MQKRIILFVVVKLMIVSSAEDGKKNLTAIIGGRITFPNAVKELGFLIKERENIALVTKGEFDIIREIYQKKLEWDRNSGLFTITDLQRNDSGVYIVDSKEKQVSISYNLRVYDSAPTPAVIRLNVSSDSCWLRCSVDKRVTLFWYRDQEILNQSSSQLYISITVDKSSRDSEYKCVAANPANNKTLLIDVKKSCGFNETESGNKTPRSYWLIIRFILGFVLLAGLSAGLITERCLQNKKKSSQTQGSK
ncbi:uncharacterized protein LOC108229089 [Kryptolebias marmoratus]|uniref:uncharacterized protein LOC108229089 n=1 Tax=Kryptolebias marmoratus TaxID=37003 RepID=UPI000D53069F|nr:uncharacterized protein LOC108229089 [Kryptolebias marmoratus]